MHLEVLDLSHNRISNIKSTAFLGLQDLEAISLDHNQMNSPSWSPHIFRDQQRLLTLSVKNNRLGSYLHAGKFQYLKSLRTLQLNENHITEVSHGAFVGLTSLEVLDMHNNQLKEVPTDSFQHITSLQELILDKNAFMVIGSHAFKGLWHLQLLHLMKLEQLREVRGFAFSDLVSLEDIELADCAKLTSLQKDAFRGLDKLRRVNLHNNGLHTLSENLLPWSHVPLILIDDNPFHCDCKLKWMPRVLQELEWSRREEHIFCVTPESMFGQLIVGAEEKDLTCPLNTMYYVRINDVKKFIAVVLITILLASVLIFVGFKALSRLKQRYNFGETTISYGSLV